MNKRITLVSLFNQKDLDKINNIIAALNESLCKVPFNKVENRIEADTLPYHITLSSWDIEKESFIVNKLANINFNNFKIYIDSLQIMNGNENSFVLYFNVKENYELKKLQEKIYNILPNEKYNPLKIQFHITITIDKDYEKIINIKNKIEKVFIPFELEFISIGLFEIYPAKLITKINSN